MNDETATGGQPLGILAQRFAREEMHWDGIGAEGVEDDEVELTSGLLGEFEPAVADNDVDVSCGVGQDR